MTEAWPRPTPTIGDRSSSAERATDPQGWAFSEPERDALHRILAARRDIRRFRADPVDEEVLTRVLAAAHSAPSVGHSQPWRFVLVQDPSSRARAAVLADRGRLAQAGAMEPAAARHLLDLDLEGIREAPLGLVVCCDRRVDPRGVLGRATFVEADMWSCACAIENLWLAARAEGLGVGWVTLFEPSDLAALVAAPPGVVSLGWLCLGWPDERPPSPGLERRGWSERLGLEDLVVRDRWPSEASDSGPTPPVSRLSPPLSQSGQPVAGPPVAGPSAGVFWPPRPSGLTPHPNRPWSPPTTPPTGSSPRLVRLERWIEPLTGSWRLGAAGLPQRFCDLSRVIRDLDHKIEPEHPLGALPLSGPLVGTLVIAAADHPVTQHGVSAYPAEITRHVAEAAVARTSVGAVAAQHAGLNVVVVDAGVAGSSVEGAIRARPRHAPGDIVSADALSAQDAEGLVAAGASLGRSLAARSPEPGGKSPSGTTATIPIPACVALGEVGVGNTTAAAALAAGLLELDPAPLVGLGAGSDSAIVAVKRRVVTAALARYRSDHPSGGDPMRALAALGGGEFAVLTGVVLGAAAGGGVVVLDGMATSVAALVAVELEPAAAAHLVAGQRSREAGHGAVLDRLGLEAILDLRLRAGEGAGAALAVTVLNGGLRIRLHSAQVR